MTKAAELSDITARVWQRGRRPRRPAGLCHRGRAAQVLPSHFDVTGLAAASVAAATLAAAEFLAAGTAARPLPVPVDSRQACAAFAAEGLFTPVGWDLPDVWDPIAGNYQAQDGWIRLHTNYAYHRAAVERVLGAGDRESVAAAVAGWKAADLETAVVAAGGCAAIMRTREDWLASPAGAATAHAPLVSAAASAVPAAGRAGGVRLARESGSPGRRRTRPYAGMRVLDLTSVIAGRSAPSSWPPTARTCCASTRRDSLRCPRSCRRRRRGSGPPRSTSRRRWPRGLRGPRRDRRRPGHRAARGRPRPARLRRRRAGRPEPGADRRLPRRLRLGRPMAGPPGLRQPRADELRASRRPAPRQAAADIPVPLPVQALDHGSVT